MKILIKILGVVVILALLWIGFNISEVMWAIGRIS